MSFRNLPKYLPFVALYYFHKQKDEFSNLLGQLNENCKTEWETNYRITSKKFIKGMMLSMIPGVVYTLYSGDLIPSILNFMVSHNYSELILGKIVEGWNRTIKTEQINYRSKI